MATSMLKKARTAAQKAATKKWQAAGAAKRKAAAYRQAYNSPKARRKRFNLYKQAMKEAGYGTKLPHGTPASVRVARFDKAQSIYKNLLKTHGAI